MAGQCAKLDTEVWPEVRCYGVVNPSTGDLDEAETERGCAMMSSEIHEIHEIHEKIR